MDDKQCEIMTCFEYMSVSPKREGKGRKNLISMFACIVGIQKVGISQSEVCVCVCLLIPCSHCVYEQQL